jgi:hypothetical protein
MLRVSKWLPMLVAATAAGCVYPDLKMGTGSSGGAAMPGGLGGSLVRATGGAPSSGGSLVSATGGAPSSGGSLTSAAGGAPSFGGVTTTAGATGVVDARAAGGAPSADAAPDTVDAARTVDAPATADVPTEIGGGAKDAGIETSATVTCDGISCPRSCCNGNVCAVSQTASMCGVGGEQCGACGPTGTTVTFNNGRAAGAMTGWGWVALGVLDTVTDPTCGGEPVLGTTYCLGGFTWNAANKLCMTGSIPAVSALNPDYTNNWGALIGVNATLNTDGTLGNFGQTLGQSFTSVTITVSGTPLVGLRAQVHRHGDPVGTNYCAAMTSGAAIPFTSFNTKCFDVPPDGVALTAADVPNLDQIDVQVSSGLAAITVTNLCITGITFSAGAPLACSATPVGGGCMRAGYSNCGSACCPSTSPFDCPATGKCYGTEAAAALACGSTACSTCVAPTNTCTPSVGGTCNDPTYVYCSGTVCCPSTSPFYCSITNLCYTTSAAAASVCGSTSCSSCVAPLPG